MQLLMMVSGLACSCVPGFVQPVHSFRVMRVADRAPLHARQANRGCLEPSQFEKATSLWLNRVIVTYNMCPWAGPSLLQGSLRITSCEAVTLEQNALPDVVMREGLALNKSLERMATTLIVVPRLKLVTFREFAAFCRTMQTQLEEACLPLTVAVFHPLYDVGKKELVGINAHYGSHKSPYPVIHLLRQSDLEPLHWKQSDVVIDDNNRIVSEMGMGKIQEINLECIADSQSDVITQ